MRPLLNSKFAVILDAAPDAMLCVDAGGRIAIVNAEAEHLFGYQRDELEGQLVEVLVPEAARAVHSEPRALSAKARRSTSLSVRRKRYERAAHPAGRGQPRR